MFIQKVFENIEIIVNTDPSRPAIFQDDDTFSYLDFKNKISQIKSQLDKKNIADQAKVGLFANTSFVGYAVIYALAARNLTYVPLSINEAELRLQKIIEVAEIRYIICDRFYFDILQKLAGKYLRENAIEILLVEDGRSDSADSSILSLKTDFANPMYLLFTSGSTGSPKGAYIDAQGVSNFLNWCEDYFKSDKTDIFLAHSRLTFDLSVFNLFLPFKTGSAVRIVKSMADQMYPGELLKNNITILLTVPRVTGLMLEAEQLGVEAYPKLKHVIFCGEKLYAAQVRAWGKTHKNLKVHNIYGPTETTVTCTVYNIENPANCSDPIAIGTVIPHMQINFLDVNQELVAGEFEGEGIISGVGVSKQDYCGFESGKFFDHPKLGRSFRTGDLLYRDKQGCFYWKARLDYQIKIRGFRVELLEIEAVLSEHPMVADAACVFNEKTQQIYAVLTLKLDIELNTIMKQFKELVETKLPSHMRPEKYIQFKTLPRNKNGKIDREQIKQTVFV